MIVSVLSFSPTNVTICLFGLVMTGTNLMGYIKCEKSHKEKVGGFLFTQARQRLSVGQLAKLGSLASKYTGGNNAGQ